MPKDMALKEHFAALVESFYTRVLNKETPLTPLADQKRTPLLAVSRRPQYSKYIQHVLHVFPFLSSGSPQHVATLRYRYR